MALSSCLIGFGEDYSENVLVNLWINILIFFASDILETLEVFFFETEGMATSLLRTNIITYMKLILVYVSIVEHHVHLEVQRMLRVTSPTAALIRQLLSSWANQDEAAHRLQPPSTQLGTWRWPVGVIGEVWSLRPVLRPVNLDLWSH